MVRYTCKIHYYCRQIEEQKTVTKHIFLQAEKYYFAAVEEERKQSLKKRGNFKGACLVVWCCQTRIGPMSGLGPSVSGCEARVLAFLRGFCVAAGDLRCFFVKCFEGRVNSAEELLLRELKVERCNFHLHSTKRFPA